MKYYLGIDVGTGSARAGLFDENGALLATAKHDIKMHHPHTGWAEQSTVDIWQAVCHAVRQTLTAAALPGDAVTAIGFDATCSLALADSDFQPLALNDSGCDVIVWMDQRAVHEAAACSATGAEPLHYVGGTMSPEMQMPKLLWLKRNRPDLWAKLGYAGDLSDWLTRQATGHNTRSTCTLTCKWGYMPHHTPGWDRGFLAQIGMEDVLERAQLPETAAPVGSAIGTLTTQAAAELGLHPGCIVSAGMIDAHAGAVLSFALVAPSAIPHTLGLVAGTSNCHMALNPQALTVPGVWGPYRGVVLPDYWLNEGGQTASGALLEHLIANYRGADNYQPDIHGNIAQALLADYDSGRDPAPATHILPDFIGNRSPYADPSLRGVISGLTFTDAATTFRHTYWAAATAIAYGTRAIMARMSEHGYQFRHIVLTGGHAKSPLLTALYADATGCDLILPDCDEPVLLGSAMTACAAAHGGDLPRALQQLAPSSRILPANPMRQALHQARYEHFSALYRNYQSRPRAAS